MNDTLDQSIDTLRDTALDLLRDYTKFKTALELIAGGIGDPVGIAEAALKGENQNAQV